VNIFGEPGRDIGSGIHIYVFDLKDSMEIWIGFADKIFHACHIDKSDIFEQVNNND
jgi:hypothetical protein